MRCKSFEKWVPKKTKDFLGKMDRKFAEPNVNTLKLWLKKIDSLVLDWWIFIKKYLWMLSLTTLKVGLDFISDCKEF